jgi:PAS domain S-box-containing protein
MDGVRAEADRGDLVRRFVEYLPDCAVIILDVDGKVLTWNAGARSILGYVAGEIVGQPYARLYGQKDLAAALSDALSKGRHEDRGHLMCKDGTKPDVLSVVIPLYDARDRHVGFGTIAHDVAPQTTAQSGIVQTLQPVGPATGTAAARILVVDDDDQIRQIAARQLSSFGYQVIETSNGAAALGVLARTADIDLLFVDLNMPDMGGHAVATEATRLRPTLKILFASGEGAPGGDSGAHFLMKPYRKNELAEKIVEVLGRR